ncbi:unnamed protein product [Adineta steineri]|uniref:Uncharacterized protein n=1 Tax=Adineta steineri TaxID=433720 RepID=A0A819N7P1_9BILA|nr:unnamed protein product [Adineta steineri]CAF3992041.1 unnamed protein product [Adineta steineri]
MSNKQLSVVDSVPVPQQQQQQLLTAPLEKELEVEQLQKAHDSIDKSCIDDNKLIHQGKSEDQTMHWTDVEAVYYVEIEEEEIDKENIQMLNAVAQIRTTISTPDIDDNQ